jgi:DNA-binding response OmpR family regulator
VKAGSHVLADVPPDIVLIGPEWPMRALLRAQLLEEGYEVVATDTWPIPRQFLRAGRRPHLAIVDLHGLTEPARALTELCGLIGPQRVLVVTALGTLTSEEIQRLGVRVVARPASVGDIVAAATALLAPR